jgi:hypothetical protein
MRRPLSLAFAAIALTGVLSACAPAVEPTSSGDPKPQASALPTPTPTPTVATIAGGEAPPAVFGGDCGSAVPAAELTAATGLEGIEVVRRDQKWTRSIDNVGGLVCEWQSGTVSGRVTILPKIGLDGAQLPEADASFYFDECDWNCEWQWESPDLVVMGYSSDLPERGRAEADRIGTRLGTQIGARAAQAGLDWQRDRAQWWPTVDCSALADRLATRLGTAVTAEAVGYHDPPGASTTLADVASRRVWCAFSTAERQIALAVLESGIAWDVPWAGLGQTVDLGVPGVSAFRSEQGGYLNGEVFEATDGVNGMNVEIAPDSGWDSQQLAAVFAEVFVSP